MFQLWRRDDDPCGAAQTVTVTETVLQGAATSTLVDFGYITTASITEELIATATGRPNVGLNAVYGTTTQTSEPTTGPTPTTDSISSSSSMRETTVSVTSTLGTTKTLSLMSASTSSAIPRASECSSQGGASRTAPAATIAGSVVGSMAGLALIGLLVSYLLKRKRKLRLKMTLKRKAEENKNNRDENRQIETVMRERDRALEDLERTRSIASPKSFDFGFIPSAAAVRSPLPPPLPLPSLLPKHKTVVSAPPPRWI
ncbi:hypothetical protein LTR84_003625 [Exophiala bonariae]|uniref:Transmembrane protein n=1 Tax=Exophiala bonariae TaxID=1690606 RepID=A0AAV9N5N3_9EURO|nr:hypothetical protein LTR84_003625 [Exophiala bonariae]